MAFSLNKIFLIGSVGQDAEFRFTQSNVEVAKFSLATSESFKKNDQWEESTTWHNIVMFKPSDFIKEKLKKGSRLHIEGRQENRSYEKDGEKKYFSEVIAIKVIPLDKSNNSQFANQESFDHPTNDKFNKPTDSDDSHRLPF